MRDILAEAGDGKEADQAEVNAIMTRKNDEIYADNDVLCDRIFAGGFGALFDDS